MLEEKDYFEEGLELYKSEKYEEAVPLFIKGMEQNDSRCTYAYGNCLRLGKGLKQKKALGKRIVKEVMPQLEKDGIDGKKGANKLLYLAYTGIDFLINHVKAFEALSRIYENNEELNEDHLIELANYYENNGMVACDYKKRDELLSECIERFNSAKAMSELANRYKSGMTPNMKEDYDKAICYYKMAFEHGDYASALDLIDIYLGIKLKGEIVDFDEAQRYIEKIREKAPFASAARLAYIYAAKGDEQRAKEAFDGLDLSDENGVYAIYSFFAEISTSTSGNNNKNSIKNSERALLVLYEKLSEIKEAQKGNSEAKVNSYELNNFLSTFYMLLWKGLSSGFLFSEQELEELKQRELEYCLKGMECNEPSSFNDYGDMLIEGKIVKKDLKAALANRIKAFELDPSYSFYSHGVAVMYEYGIGTKKSREKALYYYTKAYEQFSYFMSAQAGLSLIYYYLNSKNPQLIEKGKKISKELFEKVKNVSWMNEFSFEESRTDYKKDFWIKEFLYNKGMDDGCGIAYAYQTGQGVKKDVKKALAIYKRVRGYNYNFALCSIGEIYYKGDGIKKNVPLAIKYFKQALVDEENAVINDEARTYLYKIYSDKDSRYYDIDLAISYLKDIKSDSFFYGEANYLLGSLYHRGDGVKKNLTRAKEYYEKAKTNRLNCSYSIEMVDKDIKLEKYFTEGKKSGLSSKEARIYARKEFEKLYKDESFRGFVNQRLLKECITNIERIDEIKKELQKDFSDMWEYLGKESQKALITGIYIYSVLVDVGYEYYQELDFAPVINQFAKAYECQLKKYFYKGYIKYLRKEKVKVSEFVNPSSTRQIAIVETYFNDKKKQNPKYRYCDENEEGANPFSLGALYYIVTCDIDGTGTNARNNVLSFGNTVNRHMLKYAKQIFSEDAFSFDHFDEEVANYLVDLANDTKTIMDRRNPSAHGAFMSIDEAEVCADYLIKVKKVIYNFMKKIKPECLEE